MSKAKEHDGSGIGKSGGFWEYGGYLFNRGHYGGHGYGDGTHCLGGGDGSGDEVCDYPEAPYTRHGGGHGYGEGFGGGGSGGGDGSTGWGGWSGGGYGYGTLADGPGSGEGHPEGGGGGGGIGFGAGYHEGGGCGGGCDRACCCAGEEQES